jgi:ATP-dependent Lhr-like helicase
VVGEGFPGGFAALYPVLSVLEEQGHVRRGYFLAGLGGSQFADPGAVEKLRILRQPPAASRDGDESVLTAAVLAATDPANPYGAALPWPGDVGRLSRVAGAHVVLVDGCPRAYLGRDARELRAFLPAEEPARSRAGRAVARALAAWALRTGLQALAWGEAAESPGTLLQPYLLEAGFAPAGRGFRLIVAPPSA